MDPGFAIGGGVIDRFDALRLGEAEEGALHHLALVAQRHVRDIGKEQLELIGKLGLAGARHGRLLGKGRVARVFPRGNGDGIRANEWRLREERGGRDDMGLPCFPGETARDPRLGKMPFPCAAMPLCPPEPVTAVDPFPAVQDVRACRGARLPV